MSVPGSVIVNSIAVDDNQLVVGAVGAAVILAITVAYCSPISKNEEREFPKLRGIQLYHAWNFFRQRYNFLRSNFEQNRGESFAFNVLHHTVIALAGEDARRVFYSDPHLNLGEGYKILMGSARVSLPW